MQSRLFCPILTKGDDGLHTRFRIATRDILVPDTSVVGITEVEGSGAGGLQAMPAYRNVWMWFEVQP